MNCEEFEDRMSDYLDRTLDVSSHRAAAAHVLKCPLCHSLVNDVRESLAVCRQMAEPRSPLTRLEAKILEVTVPDTSLRCSEFEEHLTDYLDGFLPAQTFHRWERHAVMCDDCTDLPGAVVRSLAAIVTYKSNELAVPAGMNERILEMTLGTQSAKEAKAAWSSRIEEWVRGIRIPISVPQLAPVAMMLMFAFLFVSQTVSADGSLSDVYEKSVFLAERTYKQGTEAWQGRPGQPQQGQEPVTGTTFVDSEGSK